MQFRPNHGRMMERVGLYGDRYKAAAQLKSLVEAQRAKAPTLTTEQLYDAVYRDPANRTITARAHPTMSSPSGDALQR
jgi:hypothetical protein